MPSTYYVAWSNLENLFDEENSPRRTQKLQRAIGADLAGWTAARRDRKISQLASVIGQMNDGASPDLLGVCEVENRFVLELLLAAPADHSLAATTTSSTPTPPTPEASTWRSSTTPTYSRRRPAKCSSTW